MPDIEYQDAVPGATEGKNELMQSPRASHLARMEGRPLDVRGDDFIVHVARFDSHAQFMQIPLVKEHVADPRFAAFAMEGQRVIALYKNGFRMPVGRAKNLIGLDQLNSQPATQPTNAPATPEPAPTTAP